MKRVTKSPRVLVVGGGTVGAGSDAIYQDKDLSVTSIDVYQSPNVDFICDAHYLPFKEEGFDGVWIQAVLEHVIEPQVVVNEIHRVLTVDGVVYAETPFLVPVHEGAFDITRFTLLGHRFLFKRFELISMGGNKGVTISVAHSLRYLAWGLSRSRHVANFFFTIALFLLRS